MGNKSELLVTEEQLQVAITNNRLYKHTVSVKDADNATFTIIFNDMNKTAITSTTISRLLGCCGTNNSNICIIVLDSTTYKVAKGVINNSAFTLTLKTISTISDTVTAL